MAKKTAKADKNTKESKSAAGPKAQPAQKTEAEKGTALKPAVIIIAAVIVIAIILLLFVFPGAIQTTVPFSTFKSNLQTSPRISITATYSNQSQFANETICFTSMIQVISHTRSPSTIDFFIIDKQTNVCTYSTTGLGGSVNPVTTNSTFCLSKAYGENGIFLNYSASNSTLITPARMYIYGNDAYLASCPVAIELS